MKYNAILYGRTALQLQDRGKKNIEDKKKNEGKEGAHMPPHNITYTRTSQVYNSPDNRG
jgi:hypothetical protein